MNSPNILRNAAAAYQTAQVTTASPAKVVVMLYDKVFSSCRDAQAAMAAGDRATAGAKISRVHAILELLATSIDPSHDRALAENLWGLYAYAMEKVTEANRQQTPEPLDEVKRVLTPLRDAWAEIAGR